MKIILVEDNEEQRQIFSDSVDVYEDQHSCKIEVVYAGSLKDANQQIDLSFDGAIIDLQLKEEDEGGNKVAENILENFPRIPIIFVTGFPGAVDNDNPLIIYSRARESRTYAEDLKLLWGIYRTGLTRILGGRGKIEQILNKVFRDNLLPNFESWKVYGEKDSSGTEKALLRFTLNHLVQLLDDDEDQCFPEEVYIYPPLVEGLKTGSIVKEKDGENLCIILSPACDLVVRTGGQINTDRILLVEIDMEQKVYGHIFKRIDKNDTVDSEDKQSEKKEVLNRSFRNQHTLYHHWLPKTSFFPGGFVNFRKLSALSKKECRKKFNEPHIQISPHFVKDILSRFSSYYARQGQPDIERNKIIEEIVGSNVGA